MVRGTCTPLVGCAGAEPLSLQLGPIGPCGVCPATGYLIWYATQCGYAPELTMVDVLLGNTVMNAIATTVTL